MDNSVVSSDVHVAGPEDVAAAVKAAEDAFPLWAAKLPQERAKILLRFADLIDENADELARLEALCSGKPIGSSKALEIPIATSTIRCKCRSYFSHRRLSFANTLS
jgi:acyl-CoA reductase-like NAD-dependent aldehyde dehydrogenase